MQQFSRRTLERIILVAIAANVGTLACASDASRLYTPCAACHQPDAGGSLDGEVPNLAGQQKRYIEKQLDLFLTGARADTGALTVAVHPVISDSRNIALLATYLAALNANPKPVEGAGDHLQLGQEAFTHICAACHGASGGGSTANRVPRIAGQHYPYLRRRLETAAKLHMDLAPPEMASALRGMGSQEKDAVADYASRLGNSEVLLDAHRFNSEER